MAAGRTWTYDTYSPEGTGSHVYATSPPTPLNGESVVLFDIAWTETTWSNVTTTGTGTNTCASRPAGAYLLARTRSDSSGSSFDLALPRLMIPFPVQIGEPALQVTCTNVRLPVEGGTAYVDFVDYVNVAQVLPTFTLVPLGTFTNVAEVQTRREMTIRYKGETVTGWTLETNQFAPGVGLIRSNSCTQLGPSDYSCNSRTLVAYTSGP